MPYRGSAQVVYRDDVSLETPRRGTFELTKQLVRIVRESGIREGLATVWVHHTSASLIICENADPSVRRDLETFMARLAPDGDAMFTHDAEGPDDMPAHVRSVLTQTSIGIPVADGAPVLGTWQGLYLWEHRTQPHRRRVSVTVLGA